MNRQVANQIDFFLGGFMSRLEENSDFFINCKVDFFSGNKMFSFTAKYENEKFCFIFYGIQNNLSSEELRKYINKETEKYEKLKLSWNERGKTYFIEADGKKATAGSTENAVNNMPEKNPVKNERNISFSQQAHAINAVMDAAMGEREYFIKRGKADRLLKVIGYLGDNGKIKNDKVRKYNQTDHFIELIDSLLKDMTASGKTVNIVDCACGKSYLSFVLNYYIKEVLGRKCYFTCIDYNEGVIKSSQKMANELGYNNMEFICCDLREYESDKKFDLMISLHACDIATDMALGFALTHDIKNIVCIPCCHKEMNSQYNLPGFERVLKYGPLKARIADSLTDGLRAMYLEGKGYETSLVEYISPLDTPKNLMLRAEKKRGQDTAILAEYYKLCDLLGCRLTLGNY